MKKRNFAALSMAAVLSVGLTGCGTTAVTNTNQYFSQMSTRFANWGNKAETVETSAATSEEDADDDRRLATPADFAIDESGNYSFTGVDNADHYIITVYDNLSDSEEYLFISDAIPVNDSNTYQGALTDYFSFSYGDFRMEVTAYPALTDKDHRQSNGADCEYLVSGAVTEPTFAYMWDCFSGTFNVELTNIAEYEYTACPETVTFTLTDTADASNTYSFTMEGASTKDSIYSASATDIEAGKTYTVTADSQWNDLIVTNPTASTELGTVEIRSDAKTASEGYSTLDGQSLYINIGYPEYAANFDLTKGGDAGTWYDLQMPGNTMFGGVSVVTFGTDNLLYTATQASASAGAKYSYTITAKKAEGTITSSWSGETDSVTGKLNLNEDGTLTLSIDYQLVGTNPISKANQEIAGSSVQGSWVDNGDGTATLSYDLSTITKAE